MRLFPSFFSLRVGRKTAILSVYACGVLPLAQKQALGLELHSPFAIFAYGKNRSKERRRLCLHTRS